MKFTKNDMIILIHADCFIIIMPSTMISKCTVINIVEADANVTASTLYMYINRIV